MSPGEERRIKEVDLFKIFKVMMSQVEAGKVDRFNEK